MPKIQWKLLELPWRLKKTTVQSFQWLRLLRQTLFYNHFTSTTIVVETAAEPMFWTVDRFAKYLGPVSHILYLYTGYIYICSFKGTSINNHQPHR